VASVDRHVAKTGTPRVVIIGFGSDLRGDDALGPMVARELEPLLVSRDDVRLETCQGLTPDLALLIADAQTVIFVDCSADGPVGEVIRQEIEPIAKSDMSMVHFLDPAALLTWTQLLYGRAPEAMALTVPGQTFEISETLSPPVAAAVPKLIDQVMSIVGEVCCA